MGNNGVAFGCNMLQLSSHLGGSLILLIALVWDISDYHSGRLDFLRPSYCREAGSVRTSGCFPIGLNST